jgi:sacsin
MTLHACAAGSQLVLFDPHCEHLPGIIASNPGKRIDYVASAAARQHPDQFAPFCAFGCDARSFFPGTLFHFPLRTPALAARSRISKQVHPFFLIPFLSSYISRIVLQQ